MTAYGDDPSTYASTPIPIGCLAMSTYEHAVHVGDAPTAPAGITEFDEHEYDGYEK